jgi:uncharacterized protein
MTASCRAVAGRFAQGLSLGVAVCLALVLASVAHAQAPSPSEPPARIVVTGEGSVTAPPDYAEITSGVTTKATTAKDATDANSKIMTALNAALLGAGIDRKDMQTSRFSVFPVYVQAANAEPRLSGFRVSNAVNVTVRDIDKLGDILDRLVAAGATDIGGIEFLHTDPSQALDPARQAAIADARRKAELYAKAAGLTLGNAVWITEEPGYVPPMPMAALRMNAAAAAPVPVAAGEDTLHVRVTVGFDVAH